MFKHLLLPTDGSVRSESAVKLGVHLASALGAKVTGMTVVRDSTEADAAQAHLDFVKIAANGNGVDNEVMSITGDRPAEEILKLAKELHCDLIVMASHGRSGIQAALLGSQAQEVLARSPVPVLLCRE